MRRSGQCTISSGSRDQAEPLPLLAEGARPVSGSAATCTARSSSGSSVRAYWMARAALLVELVDQHEHRVAAQDRRLDGRLGASYSSSAFSASYWRFSRTSRATMTGTSDHDEPGAVGELGDGDDDGDDAGGDARRAPLMTRPSRQPGSLSRRWRLAMPACESVNEVNTPMA